MVVAYHSHEFQIPTASDAEVAAGTESGKVVTPATLGSSTAFATAAQGALADTALQPADVGTAAAEDVGYFATAAQGALADTSIQPADLATVATSGSYADLTGLPTLGTAAAANTGDFATAAQGALAASAVQIGDAVAPALAANTMLVDNAAGDAREQKTFQEVSEVFEFAAWTSGTTRTMKERATDTYCILDAPGSPDPTGANDSTTALQAMVAEGVRCEITKGDFVTLEPILITTPGQTIFGHGGGTGYSNFPGALNDYIGHSRIVAAGDTAPKRVMTRRLMRSVAEDPNDAPMNAVIDVQADGVRINDLTVWLDCDYSNASPSNLGANWDVGVMVGTRPAFKARDLQVLGYFRQYGLLLDVSDNYSYPALLDYDGNPLDPQNPSVFSGGDGTVLYDPYIRGAKIGLGVVGGLNDADGDYLPFGGVLGADARGASGFSDFNVFAGRLYGRDHHSGYRGSDPKAVPLTESGLLSEADADIYAALFIDGRCGNGGSTTYGIGAIRGMNFFNTRVSSMEKMRAYIRRADEVSFIGRSWSDVPTASPKDTLGNTISSQDYVNSTYGHFTTHPALQQTVRLDAASGGVEQKWVMNKDRLIVSSAAGHQQVTGLTIRKGANASPLGDAARVNLADDKATSFPIPGATKSCIVAIMTSNGADATAPRGTFLVRSGAAPVALSMASTANITFTTGALADGDGTDGNVTISTHSDGMLYISNRANAARTIAVQFLAPT